MLAVIVDPTPFTMFHSSPTLNSCNVSWVIRENSASPLAGRLHCSRILVICVCWQDVYACIQKVLFRNILIRINEIAALYFASPARVIHWCSSLPLSSICLCRVASKSRTGRRVHQQHFVQEDPGPAEGEGDLGCQLWEGGGISHKWTVKEAHASEWWKRYRKIPVLTHWLKFLLLDILLQNRKSD